MSAAAEPVEQPTPVGLLDAVRTWKSAEMAAQVEQLKLIVEWCAAHEVEADEAATVVEFGRDTGLAKTASKVTLGQIERNCADALARFDPAAAEEKRQAALDGRRVEVHLK